MAQKMAFVLVLEYSDKSGFGVVRTYTNKERAEQDLGLVKVDIGASMKWSLVEVPLVGELYDPNTLRGG